jgi:hypothetical protein
MWCRTCFCKCFERFVDHGKGSARAANFPWDTPITILTERKHARPPHAWHFGCSTAFERTLRNGRRCSQVPAILQIFQATHESVTEGMCHCTRMQYYVCVSAGRTLIGSASVILIANRHDASCCCGFPVLNGNLAVAMGPSNNKKQVTLLDNSDVFSRN